MSQLTVKAAIESLSTVMRFVNQLLEENHCDIKAKMKLNIAVDELFSNIAYYAYPDSEGEATVIAAFDAPRRIMTLTFIDSGIPYNPLAKEDPDIMLPAEERNIGGLGIFIVRKTMDNMTYAYRDGRNVLTIMKKI